MLRAAIARAAAAGAPRRGRTPPHRPRCGAAAWPSPRTWLRGVRASAARGNGGGDTRAASLQARTECAMRPRIVAPSMQALRGWRVRACFEQRRHGEQRKRSKTSAAAGGSGARGARSAFAASPRRPAAGAGRAELCVVPRQPTHAMTRPAPLFAPRWRAPPAAMSRLSVHLAGRSRTLVPCRLTDGWAVFEALAFRAVEQCVTVFTSLSCLSSSLLR